MTGERTLHDRLAEEVHVAVRERGATVAVAESLTGGSLAAVLARAEDAGEWFLGGVVAYTAATKQRALGLPEGPVITAEAARAMARGVRELTGADFAVAVTGVGGPGEEEGQPAGTVFVATSTAEGESAVEHAFAGDPLSVVDQTIEHALRRLAAELSRAATPPAR